MPRISFHIDDKLFEELKEFLPWGIQAEVFRGLTMNLVEARKEYGTGIIGLIVNGQLNLITKNLKKEEPLNAA